MAITVDWANKIINIPRADMALIQSVPTEIRQLNLDTFRRTLKDLEDDPAGMPFLDTHQHNTTVEVGGVILSRVIEIINGYTVTFEDGQYAVNLVGANSNVGDVVNVNQVSVRSANSAGLQDLSTLLASAYQGRVVIDVIYGQSGTDTPIGTYSTPVDNIPDALIIASVQGLHELLFVRSTPIVDEDLSAGFLLVGSSPFFTITASPAADLTNCEIRNLTVVGELDGLNVLKDCIIGDVTSVSGILDTCSITSSMGVNGDTTLRECYSNVPGNGFPTLSAPSGNLVIRDFHGSICVRDIVSGTHSLGISGEGRLIIDPTCTGGNIHPRGSPYVIDDHSGIGCIVAVQTESHKVSELFKLQGLDVDCPMTVTPTTRTTGEVTLAITGDGITTTTVTRESTIFTIVDELGNFLIDELENNIVG